MNPRIAFALLVVVYGLTTFWAGVYLSPWVAR